MLQIFEPSEDNPLILILKPFQALGEPLAMFERCVIRGALLATCYAFSPIGKLNTQRWSPGRQTSMAIADTSTADDGAAWWGNLPSLFGETRYERQRREAGWGLGWAGGFRQNDDCVQVRHEGCVRKLSITCAWL